MHHGGTNRARMRTTLRYLSIHGMRDGINERVVHSGELGEHRREHGGEGGEGGAAGESPQQRHHCNATRKVITCYCTDDLSRRGMHMKTQK